ncbi:MAG: hypothetical protein K6T72_14640 [Anoxybacillus sp.]|nr:hypothetical protein [Anoxybacillus sp.]MCL6587721.1 hypothetical protein [Anoxybacillus sp.]
MLAEIHGKISSNGSNFSERLEDQLTANMFGTLRYLPFHKGLQPLLSRAVFFSSATQTVFQNGLAMQNDEFIGEKVTFWAKRERSEMDVWLELDYLTIGIEVKYHSPLSSDDQLVREAMDLLADKRQTPKFLLLLGKEPEVNMMAKRAIEERKLPSGVHFGYMSWQEVFMQLMHMQKDETLNEFERLMLKDLVALLRKKGFERFQCFQHLSYPIVEYGSYFCFHSDEQFFHFDVSMIEKGRYYEFQ